MTEITTIEEIEEFVKLLDQRGKPVSLDELKYLQAMVWTLPRKQLYPIRMLLLNDRALSMGQKLLKSFLERRIRCESTTCCAIL